MKTWVCANCNEAATSVVKDKVWNKPVCHSCKQQALNLNVRFEFDFESINVKEEDQWIKKLSS